MDITEADLMQILNDADGEGDATLTLDEATGITQESSSTEGRATGGILDEDEQYRLSVQEILEDTITELGMNDAMDTELKNILLNDILLIRGPKKLMLRKYSDILQTFYCRNQLDSPEIHIKHILVTVIPKVMQLRNESNSAADTAIIALDMDRVNYLSSAVLRWGRKKFTGDDLKWLETQIVHDHSLDPEFRNAKKGYLPVPTDEFLAVMTETELEVLGCFISTKRLVDKEIIIETVCLSDHVIDMYFQHVLKQCIGGFIQLRVHIHRKQLDSEQKQL